MGSTVWELYSSQRDASVYPVDVLYRWSIFVAEHKGRGAKL